MKLRIVWHYCLCFLVFWSSGAAAIHAASHSVPVPAEAQSAEHLGHGQDGHDWQHGHDHAAGHSHSYFQTHTSPDSHAHSYENPHASSHEGLWPAHGDDVHDAMHSPLCEGCGSFFAFATLWVSPPERFSCLSPVARAHSEGAIAALLQRLPPARAPPKALSIR